MVSFGYYIERLVDRVTILRAGLEGVRPCGEDRDTGCLLPAVYGLLDDVHIKKERKRISAPLTIELMTIPSKSNVVS